jgi:hypothetical protein
MATATPSDRGYGWARQTDFVTAKAIANGNFKQIMATDQNMIDYTPALKDDDGWATGLNQASDQWVETHDCNVAHTIPGHSQEIGKVLAINGSIAISTPSGGTLSRKHTFKPTDPAVTRQDPAVSYVERLGAGWNVLMPRAVSDGFTIKGDDKGVLSVDFNLLGAGLLVNGAGATFPPATTPTVTKLSGLHKLFNTQVALVVTDNGTPTTYACRYKSFQIAFKKTMLSDAGYQEGCADFFVSGDPTSGIIRSAHEFDKQMLDFTLTVKLGSTSPELTAVQQQKPLDILISAVGGFIEGAIPHQMDIKIPVGKYQTSKPTFLQNIAVLTITGKAFFDYATGKLFSIELTNDVTTYATAF